MSEIRLVLFFFVALGSFFLLRGMDPLLTIRLVLITLAVIAVGMTLLNLIQAWRRDPRFLPGAILGTIQVIVGIALTFLFQHHQLHTGGLALSIGPLYVGGALLVWMVALLGFLRTRIRGNPTK